MENNDNSTDIEEFFLLGFPGLTPQYYVAVGTVLLVIYLLLVGGNILTIVCICYEKNLKKPTHIIFCNLAIVDFAFGTIILPKIIAKYLFNDETLTFQGCFVQMFFVHYFGAVTSFILLLMAIDRFIAICNPLRYPSLVTNHSIAITCGIFWLIPVSWLTLIIHQTIGMPFCESNIIAQFFCDQNSISLLACGDIRNMRLLFLIMTLIVLLGPLVFIIFSYLAIIVTVLKIPVIQTKYKVFSTCSPQLFIICLYYLPRCAVYITDMKIRMNVNTRVFLVMWYSLLPPLTHPFIFFFRSKEIRKAIIMKLNKRKISNQLNVPLD
ncbi:olfactory receptor 1500-like [Hemibagrus wyckioides]|uniref:olfactory receptor 1500-like n=1 Tax=Hemibagrus wyckioides TaxID=337641 RepID=UPI00266D1055|nr:olfactory receptor 1500-like [Hemibagrus wyckioides]